MLKNDLMDYNAFHKMSYGLYIVASEFDGKKAGYIGNTVFQVTSEPPKLAISCHKNNFTTGIIRKRKSFSVSVLKKELPVSLIGEFGFMSSAVTDKFTQPRFQYTSDKIPVVTEHSVAWFVCDVVEEVDCGSHFLFIAQVVDSGFLSDEEPLTYDFYREKYKMLAPKNAPTYLDKEKISQQIEHEKIDVEDNSVPLSSGSKTFICSICGFTYDPEEGDPTIGIPPGTSFSDLPEDYRCPICNAGKEYFK
jgi:flavin reductase (DIM6/NTAB) family NADH-FMN oxidoreductase RutF/rubredoxin